MISIPIRTDDWMPLLSCAKMYTDEAVIHVEKGFARVVEVDATHTQMIDGIIEVATSETCDIPVLLDKFMKALSAAGKDPTIEIDEGFITMYGEHTKIKIPLIIRESNFNWPPKFDETPVATCDIQPSLLAQMVAYGQSISSAIARFTIKDTKMTVEIGEMPDLSEIQSPATAVGETVVTVSLPYLDAFIKHVKALETITVCGFGDDVPIMFKWENGTGHYRMILAPWIED